MSTGKPTQLQDQSILNKTSIDPTALFLGPQGQNADVLERAMLDALRGHVHWRRGFHPEDPDAVSPFHQQSSGFKATTATFETQLRRLLARLKSSVPFHSPRYLGHMVGDTLIPAQVGYLAGMLYNPNNVALEGSPVTSLMEEEVGSDLAKLLGFNPDQAWGHLCSGGTVANIEALWAWRNLARVPLRLAALPKDQWPELCDAAGRSLNPASAAELLGRLTLDTLLELEAALPAEGAEAPPPMAVLTPVTRHYSWAKAVDLLGLGASSLVPVPVDSAFRMDPEALERVLEELAAKGTPVLACVAVVGTTEGGGVDPVHRVLEIRDRHADRHGRWFPVHLDAAYGGYARSLYLRPDGTSRSRAELAADGLEVREELVQAMAAVPGAESATVDPHKLGFLPYPAGALVFRDRRVRDLTACHAPYINQQGGDGAPRHGGSFILEGSKPGAAASACWLAHRVVSLDCEGYGRILLDSFRSAQGLAELLDGRRFGAHRCAVMEAPDLDVLLYAFAPDDPGGDALEAANATTRRVLQALPPTGQGPFALTSTTLSFATCGAAPLPFLARLGVPAERWKEGAELLLLRSVMMTPFVAEPEIKTFYRNQLLEVLAGILER